MAVLTVRNLPDEAHRALRVRAAECGPNLTLKKIPEMVLARCEWKQNDCNLNVANLPMAKPQPQAPTSQLAAKGRGKKPSDTAAADMFGSDGEGA